MLRSAVKPGTRVMMTLDAVGGVWRYAVDLASALEREGVVCLLVGSGPPPGSEQQREREARANITFHWTDLPLDWMVDDPAQLDAVAPTLLSIAEDWGADLLHLNLPSQAAGMDGKLPVVVTSHSCLPTWWRAVKTEPLVAGWEWHRALNRQGFDRSCAVTVPTVSHAAAISHVYGPVAGLHVVPNATTVPGKQRDKEPFVFAAGRWWDEGKGAAVIDAAASLSRWPVVLAGGLSGPNRSGVVLSHASSLGLLPAEAVREQMARAAIFASPSLYEPFGLAVLEAAAAGTALVLSDIPSFRELWDGAALFVPPRDADRLAAALNYLAVDSAARQALASSAACRAKAFTLDRQRDGMLAVYAQALETNTAMA